MNYTNSPLVVYTKLSPNYNKRSDAPKYGYTECIKNIAIHHMAGALSLETCGNVFQNKAGSSNYGVDNSGRVGMYVEEKNRAWTTSTRRDFESITIEVTTYTDKDTEDKGMYAYDDYNKALSTFHTKMGGMMNRETTKTEYCFIVDDIGNMIVCEKYVKPGTDIEN